MLALLSYSVGQNRGYFHVRKRWNTLALATLGKTFFRRIRYHVECKHWSEAQRGKNASSRRTSNAVDSCTSPRMGATPHIPPPVLLPAGTARFAISFSVTLFAVGCPGVDDNQAIRPSPRVWRGPRLQLEAVARLQDLTDNHNPQRSLIGPKCWWF